MFLNLVFKSMKADPSLPRVKVRLSDTTRASVIDSSAKGGLTQFLKLSPCFLVRENILKTNVGIRP